MQNLFIFLDLEKLKSCKVVKTFQSIIFLILLLKMLCGYSKSVIFINATNVDRTVVFIYEDKH